MTEHDVKSMAFSEADVSNNKEAQEAAAAAAYRPGILKLGQGSLLYRFVWAGVVVGVTVGFVLHLLMLMERYQAYPVNTVVDKKIDYYEFPDVTICPTNFISRTYGEKPVPSKHAMPNATRGLSDIVSDVSKLFHVIRMDNKSAAVPQYPYESYRDAKLVLGKIAYRSKQFAEPHDFVAFCRFNSELCSYKNFTVILDEEYFQCITFSPQNNTVINSGPGNGLYLVFFTNTRIPLTPEEEIDHKSGIRILLHQRGTKPNFDGPSILVPREWKSDAIIDTYVDNRLNRDPSPCAQTLPNATYVSDYSQMDGVPRTASYFGSEDDCRFRIVQQEFLDKCGCLASNLPMPADIYNKSNGVCHDINEEILFRNIESTVVAGVRQYTIQNGTNHYYPLRDYVNANMHLFNKTLTNIDCYFKVLNRQKTEGLNYDSCPVMCNKISYEISTSKHTWPRSRTSASAAMQPTINALHASMKELNLTLDDLNEMKNNLYRAFDRYMGLLDLYPREMLTKITEEDWAYPLRNFFSDLGGILGLWIGASIVTLVEALEGLVVGFIAIKKKMKDMEEEKMNNSVQEIQVQEIENQENDNEVKISDEA